MTATHAGGPAGTRAFPAVAALHRARFDPRMVVAALVILGLGNVGGYLIAGQAAQKADDVAGPVASLCQQGGPTGAQLADTGACGAAADVSEGTGPFQSEVVAGPAGVPGQPGADSQVPGPGGAPGGLGKAGEPGADSQVPGPAGQNGVSPACLSEPGQCRGPEGKQGEPGQSPPCLSEPGQCRGPAGQNGTPGTPGAPGPACPDGTTLQPVTFADGQQGQGCVSPAPPPADPEPTG